MAYDLMGNYTGPDDTEVGYETEEQRRRRLAAEQANAVVHTTTVKTYGDGTQEETTKRTVAGPVAPDQTAAETARLSRQNAQPGYGVQDYLNYVRQNESGNNYNIGYHYQPNAQGQRASSAYGAYGITAPAYQDIQAADPYFQGRDITSLTPEDQDRAAQTYRQVQMRQMGARGMEPTEANLRGAQYAGVGGLNQYQQQGRLAPGVDERTLQQRMAGGGAPASGAAQRPLPPGMVQEPDGTLRMTQMPQQQPAETPSPYALTAPSGQGLQVPGVPTTPQPEVSPYIKAYQDNQDDIMGLLPIARDDNAPEFIRQRASERAAELNRQDIERKKAEAQIANMSPVDVARSLQSKGKEGSWVKAILFGILGMEQSQKEEAAKLGIGKWEDSRLQMPDGTEVAVQLKRAPNGQILEGSKMDGTPLTKDEISSAISGTAKATDISMTPVQAMVNGELHTFSVKRTPNGLQYKDNTAGTGWTTKAPAGMTHVGQQDPAHVKGLTAKNSVETKMRKANQDAVGVGGQPLYTEDQISAAGNNAYASIAGKTFPGAPAGGGIPTATEGAAPAPAAPAAPKGKSQAQAILDYEVAPPIGPTTPAKTALLNEVQRLAAEQGKTWDAGHYKIINKTRQDFTTGPQGKAVQSMNVAVDHLDTLGEAAKALKNGDLPLFNQIGNLYSKNTGSPAVTDFNALKTIVGSEVAKAVAGGATALGDREEIRKEIDAANSPDQLAGVIRRYQQLMAGQVKGLRQTYESAGLTDFDKKLLPRTQRVLNEMEPPSRSKW